MRCNKVFHKRWGINKKKQHSGTAKLKLLHTNSQAVLGTYCIESSMLFNKVQLFHWFNTLIDLLLRPWHNVRDETPLKYINNQSNMEYVRVGRPKFGNFNRNYKEEEDSQRKQTCKVLTERCATKGKTQLNGLVRKGRVKVSDENSHMSLIIQ